MLSKIIKTVAISIMLVTSAMIGTANASSVPSGATHQVNNNLGDGFLNVRSGPGVGNRVVGQIYTGQFLNLISVHNNGWVEIQLHNGPHLRGYVNARYIRNLHRVGPLRSYGGSTETSRRGNATSCGGKVRRSASMSSRQVGSLSEGQRIRILSAANNWMNGYRWYKVRYNGRTGYQWGGILSADDQRSGTYVGC